MNREEARRRFAEMVARPESEIELDRAALLIAAEEYPRLNVERYLAQLDHFAGELRGLHESQSDPLLRLLSLSDYLFNQLGFHGNTKDYYDARNSFLNDVIDRRTGIPITLAVVYIEVARRLSLPVSGVGMPGHFLARYSDGERDIILDPFREGRILSVEKCQEMFEEMYGDTIGFQPGFLSGVSKKQILARMLNNLKGIYARVPDHHRMLTVIERALLVNPGAATEIRDRGLAYASLGRRREALADLRAYLRRMPQAEDADEVKEKITELRREQAQLN
ncbi:MAG TPA: tetratricopeptide repeat protein [Blastocatellia bacterium]|nr:tetratricopeptide repeat protein [Blastocatellia bacterium]